MKRLPMLLAAGTLLAATASTLAAADVRVGFYATPAYYPYGPRYYVPYAPRYYYPRPYYAYPPLFARPLERVVQTVFELGR